MLFLESSEVGILNNSETSDSFNFHVAILRAEE